MDILESHKDIAPLSRVNVHIKGTTESSLTLYHVKIQWEDCRINQAWLFPPIIPDSCEVESGGLQVWGQPRQGYLKNKRKQEAWGHNSSGRALAYHAQGPRFHPQHYTHQKSTVYHPAEGPHQHIITLLPWSWTSSLQNCLFISHPVYGTLL
jgi:hypothetical protein